MKAFVHGSSSLAVELVLIFFSNVSLMGLPPPNANWIFLARADDHPAPGQVVGHDDLTALDEMGIDSLADRGMAPAPAREETSPEPARVPAAPISYMQSPSRGTFAFTTYDTQRPPCCSRKACRWR